MFLELVDTGTVMQYDVRIQYKDLLLSACHDNTFFTTGLHNRFSGKNRKGMERERGRGIGILL
jgi:hypothetical protein